VFIDSSTYRLLLDNRKLFTADQARGKTFNNKQQHSISRKALPRIHEEEKKEKAKKNKCIVNQTKKFFFSISSFSPIIGRGKRRSVFSFDKNLSRQEPLPKQQKIQCWILWTFQENLLQVLFLENRTHQSRKRPEKSQKKEKKLPPN